MTPPAVTIEELVVDPVSATVLIDGTQPFSARVLLSDGTSQDVTSDVSWTVSDNVVALYEHPTPQVHVSNPMDWIKWARPLMLLGMITFGVFQFSRRGRSYRAEAAAAQIRPELLRAQKQLFTNQRRMM